MSARAGRLDGRVAIVTGAGRGIGRAIARALAAEGAVSVLAARTREELAAAAAEIREAGDRAHAVPTDVARDTEVEALADETVAQFGRIDILVTAAGAATFGRVSEGKPQDWDAMLAVNLRAVMLCCRAVLPAMLRQRAGTILNVASIAARRPIPGAAAYSATKAAVLAWSRVLAEELRTEGVRVGVLLPGAVDTALWDGLPGAPPREQMLAAEDVARAAVLMATLPPRASLEELSLLPAGGIL